MSIRQKYFLIFWMRIWNQSNDKSNENRSAQSCRRGFYSSGDRAEYSLISRSLYCAFGKITAKSQNRDRRSGLSKFFYIFENAYRFQQYSKQYI